MTIRQAIFVYLSIGMAVAAMMLMNRDFLAGVEIGFHEAKTSSGRQVILWIVMTAVCVLIWPLVVYHAIRHR